MLRLRLTAAQPGLGAAITQLQCAVATAGISRLLSTTAADEVNSEMAQFGIGPLASTAAQATGGAASPAAAPAVSSLAPELLSAVQEVNSELLRYFGTRPAQHDGAAVGESAAAALVRQLSAPAAHAGSTGLNAGSRASTSTHTSSSSSSSSSTAKSGAGSGAATAAIGAAVGGGGSQLTHVDASGKAAMVDVSHKADTVRTATAGARVLLGQRVFDLVASNQMAKGDVLTVAQLAGVMGAKHTATLIPLCHNILLSRVHVTLRLDPAAAAVDISASATTKGPTGVEMEALTAASVAALTVYDMCKAVSKGVVITDVRLLSKSGGKSGDWVDADGGGGGSAAVQ